MKVEMEIIVENTLKQEFDVSKLCNKLFYMI